MQNVLPRHLDRPGRLGEFKQASKTDLTQKSNTDSHRATGEQGAVFVKVTRSTCSHGHDLAGICETLEAGFVSFQWRRGAPRSGGAPQAMAACLSPPASAEMPASAHRGYSIHENSLQAHVSTADTHVYSYLCACL